MRSVYVPRKRPVKGFRGGCCRALTYQLFTRFPCVGDCNNDGTVAIDELVTLVGVALGRGQIERCLPGDRDRDGAITIDEIVTASTVALGEECGAATGARHER